jgi:hypothetical protein
MVALEEGEWLASRPSRLTSGKWVPDSHVGPDAVEKREALALPGVEPRPIGPESDATPTEISRPIFVVQTHGQKIKALLFSGTRNVTIPASVSMSVLLGKGFVCVSDARSGLVFTSRCLVTDPSNVLYVRAHVLSGWRLFHNSSLQLTCL